MADDRDSKDKSGSPSTRPLASIPPPTDEIDEDWGAEPQAAEPQAAPAVRPASVPPPTDEIDDEWGGTGEAEKPAAQAPVASVKPATTGAAPAPKSAPAPASASAPAASKSGAPQSANPKADIAARPMHKATLIGMAPVIPPQASVPKFSEPEPPIPAVPPVPPAVDEPPPVPPVPEEVKPAAVQPSEAPKAAMASESKPGESKPQTSAAPPSSVSPPSSVPASETSPETYDPPSFETRRGPNVALVLAIAAGVALVIYWTQFRSDGSSPADTAPVAAKPDPTVEKAAEPAATATETAAPTAGAAPSQASAGSASAAASADAPATPPAEGTKTISIVTRPPGARLFRAGKEVGTTPLTIDLPPGEKRSFEVGLPGHITRKLIVDGTKTEIVVGLRPTAPSSSAPH